MQKLSTFLWFNGQAEDAANFYISIFPGSKITHTMRVTESWPGVNGSVLTVEFEAFGQNFVALNGGPAFTFTPAVSFMINCDSQDELDDLWDKLLSGGGTPVQCGWLKDKFGVSWQVVPRKLFEFINDPDTERAGRVAQAMFKMVKLDLPTFERAYRGE